MQTQHTDVNCLPSRCHQAAFFYISHDTQEYITVNKFPLYDVNPSALHTVDPILVHSFPV